MVSTLERFFGSEKEADEISKLDEELGQAIGDLKKLEEDWKEKVRQVREFLENWDKKWNLSNLKNNIKIVRRITLKEKHDYKEYEEAVLYIRHFVETEAKKREFPVANYVRVQQIFQQNQAIWNEIEGNLQAQLKWIDEHNKQDIGIVQFKIKEFIILLNVEYKLLGLDRKSLKAIVEVEKLIKKRLLGGLSGRVLYQARKRLLIKWGFKFNSDEVLGNLLIHQWEYTTQISKFEKKDYSKWLFHDGLRDYRNIILKYGLGELIELLKLQMSIERGNFSRVEISSVEDLLLKYGLKEIIEITKNSKIRFPYGTATYGSTYSQGLNFWYCRESIKKYGLRGFVEISKSAYDMSNFVFANLVLYGSLINSEEDLIKVGCYLGEIYRNAQNEMNLPYTTSQDKILLNFGWPIFVEISNISGEYFKYVHEALILIFNILNKDNILNIAKELTQIVKAASGYRSLVVKGFEPLIYGHGRLREDNLLNIGLSLVEVCKAADSKAEVIISYGLAYCMRTIPMKDEDILSVGLILVDVGKKINGDRDFTVFNNGLMSCRVFLSLENLREVGLILADIVNLVGYFSVQLLKNIQSKDELYNLLKLCQRLSQSHAYYTVQGLNSMNFMCCHVTNAFFGGAAGTKDAKQDPFNNIKTDISNLYDYNPSVSIISTRIKASLAVTEKADIKGSIGVIYDYGYIYEAYHEDASTVDVKGKKSGIAYRTGKKEGKLLAPGIVANLSTSHYNEVLIRKWTVSGIFYTKGCQEWVIEKLKQISNDMSFKEYIYGAYWYRKTPLGTPQKIIKVFPVYEIDTTNNNWQILYTPENPNYEIKLVQNNNTYVAIHK